MVEVATAVELDLGDALLQGALGDELAHELGDLLRQTFGDRVLGPDRPAVARVRSMYVRKLMLKIEKQASANKVRSLLFDIQARLLQQPSAHGVQIYYDVDPM